VVEKKKRQKDRVEDPAPWEKAQPRGLSWIGRHIQTGRTAGPRGKKAKEKI